MVQVGLADVWIVVYSGRDGGVGGRLRIGG